jgi:hypothetical protein
MSHDLSIKRAPLPHALRSDNSPKPRGGVYPRITRTRSDASITAPPDEPESTQPGDVLARQHAIGRVRNDGRYRPRHVHRSQARHGAIHHSHDQPTPHPGDPLLTAQNAAARADLPVLGQASTKVEPGNRDEMLKGHSVCQLPRCLVGTGSVSSGRCTRLRLPLTRRRWHPCLAIGCRR